MRLRDDAGNEYEFNPDLGVWFHDGITDCHAYGILTKKTSPSYYDIQVGDWYYDTIHVYRFTNCVWDRNLINTKAICEIRRSDGTIWRREP